jgi:predicted lysophospholipase L1 biosynthesis ABC-type transport system permease subunit
MSEKQNQEYLEDIKEIRSMMERSSRFISLSGLSGISAGVVALAGAITAWTYIKNNLAATDYSMSNLSTIELKDLVFLTVEALIVLFLALGLAIYFAMRKARIQNLPVWNKAAELTFVNLFIPLVAGGIFCMILFYYNLYLLIAPVTLIFYGLALLNASKYTLHEIRWLGITETVLGLIACFTPGYSIIFWALGFGILHIIYGAVMYYRYER